MLVADMRKAQKKAESFGIDHMTEKRDEYLAAQQLEKLVDEHLTLVEKEDKIARNQISIYDQLEQHG